MYTYILVNLNNTKLILHTFISVEPVREMLLMIRERVFIYKYFVSALHKLLLSNSAASCRVRYVVASCIQCTERAQYL